MSTHALSRRGFLAAGGSLLALTYPERAQSMFLAQPSFQADPFALGVSSGDPLPNAIVLWTRLIPQPGAPWAKDRVKVNWEVAADEKMTKIVRKDSTFATPELGHSVHVDATGLKPDTWYYYRFLAGGEASPVGRTKTAPDAKARNGKLNFAFASCQHFEMGHYTAYQHMIREADLDLIVHLGDYIYEGPGMDNRVRKHTSLEIKSLTDYRNRYALYRSDAHLREAHRLFPWIVTWDDHEVDNNYAGDIPEDNQTRQEFLERRANAYQAYYEFMPLRRTSLPQGSNLQLYRDFTFGSLAHFAVLDTRQYRTDQPCGDGDKAPCEGVFDPKGTMLGPKQEEWLKASLSGSKATWNVLANQVMMGKVDRKAGEGEIFPMDQWGGYEVARARLMRFFAGQPRINPVVITGDIHSNWVADLKEDWRNMAKPAVATEFVGTSITSGGDGADMPDRVKAYLPENPQIKFYNGQRGYVRCSLTPGKWTADYRIIDKVSQPNAPLQTRATYVVEAGRPGAQRA